MCAAAAPHDVMFVGVAVVAAAVTLHHSLYTLAPAGAAGRGVLHREVQAALRRPVGAGPAQARLSLRCAPLHRTRCITRVFLTPSPVIDSKWSWVGEFDGKLDFLGWGLAMRPDGSVFKEGKWDGKGNCIGNSTGIRSFARAFVYAEVSNPELQKQAPYLYRKLSPEIPAANIVVHKEAPGYSAHVEHSVALSPLFKHSKPDARRSELDIAFERPDNAIAAPPPPKPSLRETFEWTHLPKGPASPSPFAQNRGSPFDMPKHKPSSAILQDPKNQAVTENMLTKQVWLRRTLPEEFFALAEQMGKEL